MGAGSVPLEVTKKQQMQEQMQEQRQEERQTQSQEESLEERREQGQEESKHKKQKKKGRGTPCVLLVPFRHWHPTTHAVTVRALLELSERADISSGERLGRFDTTTTADGITTPQWSNGANG